MTKIIHIVTETHRGSNLQVFARLFDDTPRAEQAPHLPCFAGSFQMLTGWVRSTPRDFCLLEVGITNPSPFSWPVKQIYHGIPSLSQALGISIFFSDKPCPIELDCHWDFHQKRTVWRVSSSLEWRKVQIFLPVEETSKMNDLATWI